jgi:hypothetical protein
MTPTRRGRGTIALVLTAAFFAGYLLKTVLSLTSSESAFQKEAAHTGTDSAINEYSEALAYIHREAAFLADDESVEDLTAATLKA